MNYKIIFYPIMIGMVIVTSAKFAVAQPELSSVKGNYLGQKPPGMKPEIFAPGIVSTEYFEHSAPAFSPDGKTVIWTVIQERRKPSRLMEMHRQNGEWTKPALVSFADTTADDFYPSFSVDGKKLYFCSRRKVPAGYKDAGLRIWEVNKNMNSWGTPVPFDTTVSVGEDYAHSTTTDGTIYFSIRRQGGRIFDIVRAKKTGNGFEKTETLPYNINTIQSEDGPFIAPDESYLIFESQRPGGMGQNDLYISFRKKDGNWSRPRNMGSKVNSKFSERFPRVSPDGKYLFFGSDRDAAPNTAGDIYWVNAQVIEELKQLDQIENENTINDDGKNVMQALYSNDYIKATPLIKHWLQVHTKDINGYRDYLYALRMSRQYAEGEAAISEMQTSLTDDIDIKMEMALIKFGAGKNTEADRIIETLPAQGLENRIRFSSIASALHVMQKYNECIRIYQLALNIQSWSVGFYNMACAYAMNGDKDKAFEALNKAIELGYNTKSDYENDTDLTSLKSDERWKSLSQKLVSGLQPEDPGKPTRRAHHEMLYDETGKSVLLIGGSTPINGGQSAIFLNDIWRYNTTAWGKAAKVVDERSGIRLACDPDQNRIYSYGGFLNGNEYSGQLRVLENDEWKVMSDKPEMKAAEAGLVYDSKRKTLIAFGGSPGRGIVNNATWEWDGNSWKKYKNTGPGGRASFAMVYDSKRNRTVLFGGAGTTMDEKFGDTWEFDGKAWTKVADDGPGARIAPGYAYDSKRGTLIIFGGLGKDGVKGDTWSWDGKEWKKLSDTGPVPRMMGYMAYDKNRDRIVLFGGRLGWPNDAGDTWEWDGMKWSEIKK